MKNRKIFCVGFHKTGTTSLAKYFESCGLSACHWPSMNAGIDYEQQVAGNWNNPKNVLSILKPVIDTYTVHTDVPWPGLVNELVTNYPNALFILSVRDTSRWWNSLAAHWSLEYRGHYLSPFERVQYRKYLADVSRRFGKVDRDAFIKAFELHLPHVRKTVPADRLLEVQIDDAGIASQLSSFASTDPKVSFPAAEQRPNSTVKAIRRLVRSRKNRKRFNRYW